jgi:hypothetical protein
MATVPAGGPSTVNGILYQLLYSLLTLGSFRATGQRLAEGRLEQATLILEPSSGGDQQTISAGKRVVTQLKARSTAGPWSLQELVREVLPDLYLAVDERQPDTEYQFITEGRRGNWAEVEALFGSLTPTPAAGDVLQALDDEAEVRFGRGRATDTSPDAFWEPGPYTARRMFRKIVDTIRLRKAAGEEPYAETCRKVWHLLRGLRFVGGVTHDSLRAAVDRWLLARVGSADRLPEKRAHLLLELARRACAGDARVDSAAFLEWAGLSGAPLTDWFALGREARDHLAGVFRRKRADGAEDVRPGLTQDTLGGWTNRAPVLVLTGASGSGKTWHGYRALLSAADSGDVALLVDARGDADRDLTEASNTFWHQIAKRDEAPPLARLRARLGRVDPANQERQLTLLVDNVVSTEEARSLVEADWEGWGVRLALTCPPNVAEAVRPLLLDRGRVVEVHEFSLDELQTYLSRVVGVPWEVVPFDVRRTLRRPLLASLFGDLVRGDCWQPRNEYELYERTWELLRARGVRPFDLDALRRLAMGVVLSGARYPWTAGDLRDVGLDQAAADRLTAAGWLRETTGDW